MAAQPTATSKHTEYKLKANQSNNCQYRNGKLAQIFENHQLIIKLEQYLVMTIWMIEKYKPQNYHSVLQIIFNSVKQSCSHHTKTNCSHMVTKKKINILEYFFNLLLQEMATFPIFLPIQEHRLRLIHSHQTSTPNSHHLPFPLRFFSLTIWHLLSKHCMSVFFFT